MSAEWPAVEEVHGRLRICTPVTLSIPLMGLVVTEASRRRRRARVVLGALLLVLAGVLALGCGGMLAHPGDRYLVEYTLVAADGNCPPYAPERLEVGPRVTGDPTCVWAPLDGDLGLNLLCGFAPATVVEPVSWDPEIWAGTVRISYAPTCAGTYAVRARREGGY